MEISAEELNILATIIANKLSQNLTKEELINLKCFIMQVANNIGFILSIETFGKFKDKNKSKKDWIMCILWTIFVFLLLFIYFL